MSDVGDATPTSSTKTLALRRRGRRQSLPVVTAHHQHLLQAHQPRGTSTPFRRPAPERHREHRPVGVRRHPGPGHWQLFVVDDEALSRRQTSPVGWRITMTADVRRPTRARSPSAGCRRHLRREREPRTGISRHVPRRHRPAAGRSRRPAGHRHERRRRRLRHRQRSNLALDDEALTAAPGRAPRSPRAPSSRPTSRIRGILTSSPAPAPDPTASTALSVFDGTNPNGDVEPVRRGRRQHRLRALWLVGPSSSSETDNAQPDRHGQRSTGAAATVGSTAVTLGLTADRPGARPPPGSTQMRFSNDGVTFSAYQPYRRLGGVDPVAPVTGPRPSTPSSATPSGNQSAVVSDTITLGCPTPSAPRPTKLKPQNNGKARQGHHEGQDRGQSRLLTKQVGQQEDRLPQGEGRRRSKVSGQGQLQRCEQD